MSTLRMSRPHPRARSGPLLVAFLIVALSACISHVNAQMVSVESQGISGPLFGLRAAACPDADGDGWGDVIVGVPEERWGDPVRTRGAAYIFSGRDGSLHKRLVSPYATIGGVFGHAVAGSPDVNGDGLGDVIIGAYLANRAYVFSGADGSLIYELAPSLAGGNFGIAVASVPDVDGDNVPDIAVGVGTDRGRLFVFSGATGAELYVVEPFATVYSARFASQVSGSPDLDGDGMGDIIVGCPGETIPSGNPNYLWDFGRAYVLSGRDGSLIRQVDTPHWPPYFFGATVAAIADIDGDGVGEYAVGEPWRVDGCPCTPGENPGVQNGAVYVFSGAKGNLLATLTGPHGPTYNFGAALAPAPDVDGRGRPDLLIGSYYESPPGYPREAGGAYLFSGETFELIRTYRSPNPRVPANAAERGSFFGTRVAMVPDASGDGRPEVFATAPNDCRDMCPPTQRGRGYIFHSCPVDFNYDGALDSRDFFDFIIAFFDGRGAADFDRDGRVTSADFFAFIGAFFGGCEW